MQSEADILSQFGAIAGAGLPKKCAGVLRLLSRTPAPISVLSQFGAFHTRVPNMWMKSVVARGVVDDVLRLDLLVRDLVHLAQEHDAACMWRGRVGCRLLLRVRKPASALSRECIVEWSACPFVRACSAQPLRHAVAAAPA